MYCSARITITHSSRGINSRVNRGNAFCYPIHIPWRVCTRFRLFSWYSFSHFPLCSFRNVKFSLVGFSPLLRQIHTQLSAVCFCVSRPVDTEVDSRYGLFTESNHKSTTFIRGFFYRNIGERNGGSSHSDTDMSNNRAEIENLSDILDHRVRIAFSPVDMSLFVNGS